MQQKQKKQSDVAVLLSYAGSYKGLTFLGLCLSAAAMVLGMLPYICIWLAVRDLIAAAPDWTEATGISRYGWLAFAAAFAGILVYFAALMCTHLAAFRTASNIRKAGTAHLMKAPLGFFDSNASGLLRNRLDGAAADTETLLAHNLADIVGAATLFLATLILMLVFDWHMGAACLLAAVISVAAMFTMMGGKNANCAQSHLLHQPPNQLAPHDVSFLPQLLQNLSLAKCRLFGVDFVNLLHQGIPQLHNLRVRLLRLRIDSGTVHMQQLTLPAHGQLMRLPNETSGFLLRRG